MSRNGSGTYSLPVGNPVVTGTTISSTWANNTLTDIANALTGSLAADGQTTASGNLNMGTNRIINLGEPSSAQDGATKYYVDQLIAALGTMAYQDADAVAITGGTVTNVTLDLHEMTNEIFLPVGPTALRDATPIQGIMRFNTDGPFYEGYVSGNWHRFLTVNQGSYTITYTAVGGGGAGGTSGGGDASQAGGGGGGRVVTSTTSVIPGTSILTMTIGGGGAPGSAGSASLITGIVSATGGSTGTANGGTSGNGFVGGSTVVGGGVNAGGGGGGASAVGANAVYASELLFGGAGGAGLETLITGTSLIFGGGGGGGAPGTGGGGGSGGGGRGNGGASATSGSVNTGGGGGGAWASSSGNGGSGVIYLSMPTLNYTGTFTGSPTVTTTGSNTVLKYTGSGTYTA